MLLTLLLVEHGADQREGNHVGTKKRVPTHF